MTDTPSRPPEGPASVTPVSEGAPSAAAPASAGAMLRALREAAGVDAAVLASALKVPVAKIEAIESDRLDLLPDVTFARGLASTICRAFDADPAPVLAHMPVAAPGLHGPTSNAGQAPFQRASDRPAPMLPGSLSRPVLVVVALLLLGALALWLLPTLPIQLGAPAPAPLEGDAPPPALVTEPVPEAALAASAASAAASAMPEAGALAPAVAASAAASAPAAGASAAAASPAPLVAFTATTSDAWVSVRDAKGKVLLDRTIKAGEQAVLASGETPFTVSVGRVDATAVTVRGEPFDLKAVTRTNVARFQVK